MWNWVSQRTCIRLNILPQFSTLEAQEGKGWIAPSEILQSLTLAFFVTDTVLLKFIWFGSVLLVNWVNYWAEQKDNLLSMDSEVGAITRNMFSCPKRQSLILYQPSRNGEVGYASDQEEWNASVKIPLKVAKCEVVSTMRSNWCFRIWFHTRLHSEEQLTILSNEEWKSQKRCSHPVWVVLLAVGMIGWLDHLERFSSFLLIEDLYQESMSEPSASSGILLTGWDNMAALYCVIDYGNLAT